jgi:hypothetical protein
VDILATLAAALDDRYEVERELGHGGMAHVFAARDRRLPRRVAIKVLRPELAQSIGPERFLQEIEIEARLQHPHILPLFDTGVAGGLPYYVMQFVEGETLRQRLEREVQLPIDEVIRIAGQVAGALDYAHSRGVIHRDIKPENILFVGDHAYVADFGIARAASAAGREWPSPRGTAVWRTETGLVIGTIGYMSPEQATATPQLDGRSDQYGLACVVYEMLAGNGETPFSGASLQVMVAKVLTLQPPSVRIVREKVPGLMDAALQRALSRTPADRFRTCGEFVAALVREPTWRDRARDVPGTRAGKVALVALGGGVILLVLLMGPFGRGLETLTADTTRYVIFPIQHEAGMATSLTAARLHDAFRRWTGVNVVPALAVEEALGRDPVPGTEARAAEAARALGAGRYVRVSVAPLGDSIRVQAALYDATARGPPLGEHSLRLPHGLAGADSSFASIADRLLFPGTSPPDGTPSAQTTRSLAAARAFARGEGALQVWDLARADSAFGGAALLDPDYGQAQLWTAVVRFWQGGAPARWHLAAEQVALGREHLSPDDRTLADAVVAHVRGDLGRACALWEEVTRGRPDDYAGWYGWARCQASDSAVVADRHSPSRWRFRTSYHRILVAHERAFELHPAILGAYETPTTSNLLETLLFTRGNARRPGWALPPDTTTFLADPSWQGDTLAFVPYPRQLITSREYTTSTAALDDAVRHQRLRFRRIAEIWAAAAPTNARALEALATSLAMLGDAAALDTLRRARRLVHDPDEGLRMAGVEVWLQVAFGLPFKRGPLERARALADSVLDRYPPGSPGEPRLLASLAALTGRANTAATYMRDSRVADALQVPPPMRPAAQVLLLYAAMGGPADSLMVLEREVEAALRSVVPDVERERAINRWMVRAATLAFPTYRFSSLSRLAGRDNYVLEFQLRWVNHDTAGLRRGLADQRESRRPMSPELLTLDGLYPEAELLASLGEIRVAAEWLEPTLVVLPRKAARELADPIRAASLVRALALRARLDEQLSDHVGAARWASAVVTLWSAADPFLQPTVQQLRRMAK